MKGAFAVAVLSLSLGGCASGTSALTPGDADEGQADAPRPDAPVADAAADARPIDAFVPPDAPPDAPPPPPPPPDACVPVAQQKLANPALDLTPNGTGWSQVLIQGLPGGPYPIITSDLPEFAAQSAPNKAWFGGASGQDVTPQQQSVTDQLFQQFTLPADTTTIVVSGFFAVGTTDSTTAVRDTFSLDITDVNGTPLENVLTLNNTTNAPTFTAFSKTLATNLAGQTVRLRGTSTNNATLHTNFFLDTFSVLATHCP